MRAMFNSLLRSKKRSRPSETTPLLAALHKYRSRHSDGDEAHGLEADDDYEAAGGQYGGELDDEDDDRRGRDGPLLPVFSSEFLGRLLCCWCM